MYSYLPELLQVFSDKLIWSYWLVYIVILHILHNPYRNIYHIHYMCFGIFIKWYLNQSLTELSMCEYNFQ